MTYHEFPPYYLIVFAVYMVQITRILVIINTQVACRRYFVVHYRFLVTFYIFLTSPSASYENPCGPRLRCLI